MSFAKTCLAAAVMAVLLASSPPAAAAEPTFGERYKDFDTRLKQCTAKYGYDPKKQGNLAANQLAPKEREWAQCAYEGVHEFIIPRTDFPQAYMRIIAEHRVMTDLVAEGRMTRADRRQRMSALIDKIKVQELMHGRMKAAMDANAAATKRKRESVLVERMIFDFQGSYRR
jgi:hypothetical protein